VVRSRHKFRLSPALLAIAGTVVALDQLTKYLIVQFLAARPEPSVEILGDWLRLSYATNTGAAFGFMPNQTGLFVAAAIVVVPTIAYFYSTLTDEPWYVRLSLGLLLGGTIGNAIDRVRQGYVVDFIDFGVGALRWPAFNVADSSFVVGSIVLVAFVIFWQQERSQQRQAEDGAAGG
jgi:signal peptidase II